MFKRTKVGAAVLAAVGSSAALFAASAMAQSTERIEITGSSIKRVDAETALPVTVLTHADIERTGVTSAQDLVSLIPSNFGGLVASNNIGATGVPSTAGLRGLASKYTLVLLNGRRVANYAFGNNPVDLNSIPLAAIDRVEVLRDGASAIYGADAVAGVINFILKKDYVGLEGSVYGTKTQHGGGNSRSVSLTGGFGNLSEQGFNVLISAFSEKDDVLKAKDRPYAASAVVPSLGINKASPRNGVPNLNFTDTAGNGYGNKGNKVAPLINPYRYNGCDNPEFALVVVDSSTCGTDYVKYIDLIPKQQNDDIVARATFRVSDNHELFAEGVYSKTKMTSSYSPAPYTLTMTYPTTGRFYPKTIVVPKGVTLSKGYTMPDGTVLAASMVNPSDFSVTPTGPISGTWRTVAGGGRTDLTSVTNNRFLFGGKGSIAGWDYEAAISTSTNKGEIDFGPGQYSYAKLTPLVASGAINVFGSQDATSLAALNSALLTGPEQSATSKATEFDVHVSHDIAQLPAGPMGFAAGVSMRKEKLDQTSYPVLASGDQVGGAGPIPSVSGDRKVLGVFTELSIPIIKNLDLSLAARYDDYKNGFGTSFSNVSPKASLSFRATKELMLRGSIGQGYRAPTLYENLRPFTSGNNTAANWSDPIRCPGGKPINNSVDTSTECNVQLSTAGSGNPNLKPEKSDQYSLGIVFSPTANINASLDYWDLSIKDAIQSKSEIQVMTNPTAYSDFIYRYDPALFPDGWVDDGKQTGAIKGSTNPAFPIAYIYLPYDNTSKFYASGLDLSLSYRQKLGDMGVFGASLEGTYYLTHGYQYFATPKQSDNGSYQDFGPNPRWRHALTFTYGIGTWNAALINNYTAGYEDYSQTRRVAPNSTWDARLAWKPIKNLELALGVKNLLDANPPQSDTQVNFQTGYDAQFADPHGRTYTLRVNYKFF